MMTWQFLPPTRDDVAHELRTIDAYLGRTVALEELARFGATKLCFVNPAYYRQLYANLMELKRAHAPRIGTLARRCPKCRAASGDAWTQCRGACPMPMSPHYTLATAARYPISLHDRDLTRWR